MNLAQDLYDKYNSIFVAIEKIEDFDDWTFHRKRNKKAFNYGKNIHQTKSRLGTNIINWYHLLYIILVISFGNNIISFSCQMFLICSSFYLIYKDHEHDKYMKLMKQL